MKVSNKVRELPSWMTKLNTDDLKKKEEVAKNVTMHANKKKPQNTLNQNKSIKRKLNPEKSSVKKVNLNFSFNISLLIFS